MKNKFIVILIFVNSILYANDDIVVGLKHKIKELKSNTSALFIATRPSSEDHTLIAYFRYELGLKTSVAFVTNGESLIEDYNIESPAQFAAKLREEAFNSSISLDTDIYFFCLPDIAYISDYNSIHLYWDYQIMISHFSSIFKKYKPDIIILLKDYCYEDGDLLNKYIQESLISLIKEKYSHLSPFVFIYNKLESGDKTLRDRLSKFKRSYYYDRVKKAKDSYKTRRLDLDNCSSDISLECVYPDKGVNDIDHLVRDINSTAMPNLRKDIADYSNYILSNANQIFSNSNVRKAALDKIFSMLTKVDSMLKSSLTEKSKNVLLRLKSTLEELRCIILDVKIDYEIDETVLTNSQVTHLTIKSIKSVNYNGNTEILFPEVENGWIINESKDKQHSYTSSNFFRMISPLKVDYHIPESIYGIHRNEYYYNFQFMVIHINKNKEYSFIKKVNVHFKYAPRFSIELSRSIIAAEKDTMLVFKLTNNSRDGVSDYIFINHPKVKSNKVKFSLNYKGASIIDTLFLKWTDKIEEYEFSIPVNIGEVVVGRILAKSILVKTQIKRPIFYLKTGEDSKILKLLNYLNISPRVLNDFDENNTIENSIIIIGPKYLSLYNKEKVEKLFKEWLNKRNHIIIFPQNAEVWNKFTENQNIILGRFKPSTIDTIINIDYSNKIANYPNKIEQGDFFDWLNQIALNSISLSDNQNLKKIMEFNKIPLIIEKEQNINNGKLIYVNLDISNQFYNISNVACKILANIMSME